MIKKSKIVDQGPKNLPIKEVVAMLKDKYHVAQTDIDFLDTEFKRRLLKDLQDIPMLNEEN